MNACAWGAVFVRHACRGCASDDGDFVFLFAQGLHGQCNSRVQVLHSHVHAVAVKPLLGHVLGNVRLVLVVGIDHFNWLAKHLAAKVFDRHLGSGHSTRAAVVGVHAGHVGQHANLHAVAGQFALGHGAGGNTCQKDGRCCCNG